MFPLALCAISREFGVSTQDYDYDGTDGKWHERVYLAIRMMGYSSESTQIDE